MMMRSKTVEAKEVEGFKARFVKGGVVDEAAIRAYAAEQAARLWTGRHVVYTSQEDMAAGFVAEVMRKIGA